MASVSHTSVCYETKALSWPSAHRERTHADHNPCSDQCRVGWRSRRGTQDHDVRQKPVAAHSGHLERVGHEQGEAQVSISEPAAISSGDVRRRLRYDPESGVFTRLYPSYMMGRVAGSVKSRGYVIIRLGAKLYLAHRLAWLYHYGVWPSGVIDHIDGCPGNNAISNLRDCSQSNNMMNRRKQKNNSSGYTGVTSHHSRSKSNPWAARIKVEGRTITLGHFSSPEAAHAAYVDAVIKYFGDFRGSQFK